MGLDPYVLDKLNSIRRNVDALNERLADPDIANNRSMMLSLSKERAANEETVSEYQKWLVIQEELSNLAELVHGSSGDLELRDMAKDEIQQRTTEQESVEKKIMLLLLPKDPNDDRNVMLEVRAGTTVQYERNRC